MGTTVEKLNKVLQTKEAIRNSINNKGGTLTESDTFSSYSTAIDNIQIGSKNEPITITENGTYTAPEGMAYSPVNVNVALEENLWQEYVNNHEGDGKPGASYLFDNYKGTSLDNVLKSLDFSNVTNMSYMFAYCSNLTSIPALDTSNATNMSYMFHNCQKLTSIPALNTSKVTSMSNMFCDCSNLTTIPALNTSKVTSISYMFQNCSNLTTIPQLDTSSVTSMSNMFQNCFDLTSIPALNTSKVTSMSNMFQNCYLLEKIDITKFVSNVNYFANFCQSLKTLIIRTMETIPTLNSNSFSYCYHFYGTYDSTYNPEGLKDGSIYVPDDKVEALKVATNWSTFADIIKPLSTYVEE